MEEEEICRVCRSEATPEQPLFHPCKCSGSIRYVHQDCLTEWLSHSGKKYCELCEYPFTFTPVYRQDMPAVLPITLFISQLKKKSISLIKVVSRAALVSFVWLIVLPYFTIWVWRLYFFLGAKISRHFLKLQNMKHEFDLSKNFTTIFSIASLLSSNDINAVTISSWLQEYKAQITIQSFLADCFKGQMIDCIIFIVFAAILLLREWIVQNVPADENIIEQVVDDPNFLQAQQDIPPPPQQQNNGFETLLNQNRPQGQQFNGLFNIETNHQLDNSFEQGPPSPTAINGEIWFNREGVQEFASSSAYFDYVNEETSTGYPMPTRASSMPPSLPSFEYDGFNEQLMNYRRAASMEPYVSDLSVNGGFSSNSANHNNNMRSFLSVHRGEPPHAPRIRHAEAPNHIRPIRVDNRGIPHPIRPIIDEDEEDFPHMEPRVVGERLDQINDNADDEDDENEDDEDNAEGFEGILNAIGMQGSIMALLQSVILMSFLIALSLGAAVWMPYLIGMLFIMTDILDLIRFPLQIARLVTDPFVDFIFFICTDYIGPAFMSIYFDYLQSTVEYLSTLPALEPILTTLAFTLNQITNQNELISNSSTVISDSMSNETFSSSSPLTVLASKVLNETEPLLKNAFNRYQSIATGQSVMDRFVCVFIGYVLVTIVSCFYLSRSANNSIITAIFGHTAQEAIRHQGIIFKVGMFVVIEIVIFPTVWGYLLDAVTLPLFSAANMIGRITYLKDHPAPSLFLHWCIGTGFIFSFALLIGLFRDVVRPGVMWFIRDPNDPGSQPIQEIVERPIGSQFKRISVSAAIYIFVILFGVGGTVNIVNQLVPGFLPLRWSISNSISVLPIDLIVMQVGLPVMVRYIQPKRTMKKICKKWFAITCRKLRLTSFMLGGRHPEEEGNHIYHSWIAWAKQIRPNYYPEEGTIDNIIGNDVSYIWEGRLLRVPRHDSIFKNLGTRRMLIPLDNFTLEPLDETDRRLGHPLSAALGGDELNTVVVYSPPNFKQRLWIFMCLLWISLAIFFCTVSIVPIMLGRYVFKNVISIESDLHDIYSFVTGGSIILINFIMVNQIYKSFSDILRQPNSQDLVNTAWQQIKQWISWTTRWIFFVISFGFMIPMLLGTSIELYFFMPLKQLDKEITYMDGLSIWAHGFVAMNVLHGFIQVFPNNPIKEAIEDVFRGGIHQMKLILCVKKILAPLLFTCIAAIGLPFITAYINIQIAARTDPELRIKLIKIAYPTALIGVIIFYLIKLGTRAGTRLAQNIREDNYLVGRTLHNLE